MVFRVVPSITLLIFFLHSSILDISLGFLTRISTHERPCYLYKKKIKDISSTTEYSASDVAFSYVEFYSGVGGWTMALDDAFARLSAEEGIPTSLQRPRRIAALDHSDLCTKVFQHNFGTDKETFQIERLTLKQVEEWQATIWTMSPPCQPHTRQHKKQKKDLDDPRSSSFLHLCSLILEMKEHSLPRMICCENVVGFESSNSFQKWRSVLSDRNYLVAHFHLSPTQVGMPNDRPRYYCVAIQENSLKKGNIDERTSLLLEYLRREDARSNDLIVHGCIPHLGIERPLISEAVSTNIRPISFFLDQKDDRSLQVPKKLLGTKAAWCFDIVSPTDRRSR
jgi:tRNA (cytosine38-C5)-methyltransferase